MPMLPPNGGPLRMWVLQTVSLCKAVHCSVFRVAHNAWPTALRWYRRTNWGCVLCMIFLCLLWLGIYWLVYWLTRVS